MVIEENAKFSALLKTHQFSSIELYTVGNILLSSSSFYCASMAHAPNVLQPYWLIVLPIDVPDLTASLLL